MSQTQTDFDSLVSAPILRDLFGRSSVLQLAKVLRPLEPVDLLPALKDGACRAPGHSPLECLSRAHVLQLKYWMKDRRLDPDLSSLAGVYDVAETLGNHDASYLLEMVSPENHHPLTRELFELELNASKSSIPGAPVRGNQPVADTIGSEIIARYRGALMGEYALGLHLSNPEWMLSPELNEMLGQARMDMNADRPLGPTSGPVQVASTKKWAQRLHAGEEFGREPLWDTLTALAAHRLARKLLERRTVHDNSQALRQAADEIHYYSIGSPESDRKKLRGQSQGVIERSSNGQEETLWHLVLQANDAKVPVACEGEDVVDYCDHRIARFKVEHRSYMSDVILYQDKLNMRELARRSEDPAITRPSRQGAEAAQPRPAKPKTRSRKR